MSNMMMMGMGVNGGGVPAFNPADYGTVVAWYKADAQAYTDGNTVTTIADSSGNGHTLTQGGTSVATFKESIINEKPVIRTADNDEYFDTAGDPYDDTQGQTYYYVAKQETNDVSVLISDALLVSVLPGFLSSTTHRTWTNTVANFADTTVKDCTTGFKLYRIIQRATNGVNGTTTIRQLGVDNGTTASRSRGSYANLRIGYNISQSFQGDWAEILIFNGEITDTEVSDYFAEKYGLTSIRSGLKVDFDANQIFGLSTGDSVTTWYDLQNDYNITEATNKPTYRTTDGKFVEFDGTNDILTGATAISNIVANNAFTIFSVVKVDSIGTNDSNWYANDAILSDTGGYLGLFLKSAGTVGIGVQDGSNANVSTSIATGAWVLVEARMESGNLYVSVNGASEQSVSCSNITTLTGTLKLGANYNTSAASDINIKKMLVYNTALSSGDRTTIREALTALYL